MFTSDLQYFSLVEALALPLAQPIPIIVTQKFFLAFFRKHMFQNFSKNEAAISLPFDWFHITDLIANILFNIPFCKEIYLTVFVEIF